MLKKAVLIGMAVLALAGCTRSETPGSAPNFTLKDLSGKKVRLTDFKGSVVLLEFWATWCPPCRESIPVMTRLNQAYEKKGLVILGVSMDTADDAELRSFVKDMGINYRILRGSRDVADDYLVRVIPAMFLVNKEGMIARQYIGGTEDGTLEKDIQALL